MTVEASAAGELPVLITGPGTEPERLILVGRPAGGRVRVREWSGADWSAPPIEREAACAEISDAVDRAVRAGRHVNQLPQVVRDWLGRGQT